MEPEEKNNAEQNPSLVLNNDKTPGPSLAANQAENNNQEPNAGQLTEQNPTIAFDTSGTTLLQEQTNPQPQKEIKKEKKLIKLIRALIWILVAVSFPIGITLKTGAMKSISYANGTHQIKEEVGNLIFIISIVILALNLIWGTIRWILRLKRQKCSAGRIIGKIIGGGVWRFAVFAPIVSFSFLIISPFISSKIAETAVIVLEQTSLEKISADYIDNKISADEYVNYSLSAAFDINALPDKYKSQTMEVMTPDLTSFMDEHFDELSEDTLIKYYEIYALPNVRFGTDASGNIGTKKYQSILSNNVYAETNNVITLDKAKLSSDEHFVVFYTNVGDSGVDDSFAENICNFLEKSVTEYEEKFGLKFEYKKASVTTVDLVDILSPSTPLYSDTLKSVQDEVLRENHISENIMDTAMPVYIIDPSTEDSSVVAGYSSAENAKILNRIASELGATRLAKEIFGYSEYSRNQLDLLGHIQSLPIIYVDPNQLRDEDSFNNGSIVISHELGHHYQNIICDGHCNSSKFVTEGNANFFAINIVNDASIENFINTNHYNEAYLGLHNSRVYDDRYDADKNGYASVMFFENLYEITNKDVSKMTAMLQINSDDELTGIKDIVGDDAYRKAMVKLSEGNILNNAYPNLPIKAVNLPIGDTPQCYNACLSDFPTGYSSSRYVYIAAEEYKNTTIKYSSDQINAGSLLGRKYDGTWETIYSGLEEFEVTIPEDGNEFELYAIVNTNYSTDEDGKFSVNVIDKDFAGIIELGGNCYDVDFDEIFKTLNDSQKEISSSLVELIEEVDRQDTDNDYTGAISSIRNDSATLDTNIQKTRETVSLYNFKVCENFISKDTSFESAKTKLMSTLDLKFNFFDLQDGNERMSVFGGFNIVASSGNIYTLFDMDGEKYFYSIEVTEK